MQDSLFRLIRLGLGTSSVDKEDISELLTASADQWVELRDLAAVQGVSAIVIDGISAIMNELGTNCFNHFEDKSFWREFIVNWGYGVVEMGYEVGNKKQLLVIDDIQRRWADAGIRMMLMKGLALASYYPVPMHRCPGDIDCYLFEDYSRGNETAKDWAEKVYEGWYKHSQIFYSGQMIENHRFFVHTRQGKSSKELNQLLCDLLKEEQLQTLSGTDVLIPSSMFNAVFLTYHACEHFLEEGLRLKQLVDWAMFLKNDEDRVDWERFYSICEKFHLRRFAEIETDFAVHIFGVQLSNQKIVTQSPYTKRVVYSTLHDNEYIFNSSDSDWSKRWHIVKNLIKHRWKYHLVYQHSILRQLWFYALGFVLKTEQH